MAKEIKITCECQHSLTVEQLQAFQGKLKSIDSEAFDKLKASIVKYGFSFPVFVWNDQILDGHQRLAAVKKLIDEGYTLKSDLLPVVPIQAKDRKEAAEKLLLINSRYAKIEQEGFEFFVQDFDIDVADMSGLLDIPEIDFDVEEEEFKGNTDPDDVPEVEETPVTKMGDIWLLGEHRLMCGDSTNIEDVEKLMNGEKADMVFTDPPYEMKAEDVENAIIISKCEHLVFIMTFKQAAEFYGLNNFEFKFDFVINAHVPKSFMNHKQPYYTHQTGIYFSSKGKETIFDCQNVIKFGREKAYWHTIIDAPRNTQDKHGHAKSVKGIKEILIAFECNLIYEPFSGSGTTIIAAQQTGRKCYTMEISPQYVDVAVKRWQDFSGNDAVLERTGETFEMVQSVLTA